VEFARRGDGALPPAHRGRRQADAHRRDRGRRRLLSGRRIGLEGADAFEGSTIQYRVKSAAELVGKHLVIFGGGDSALRLDARTAATGRDLVLVHRGTIPRRAGLRRPHAGAGGAARMRCVEALPHSLIVNDGVLRGVTSAPPTARSRRWQADQLLGFSACTRTRADRGSGIGAGKKALTVDTEKFQTSLPGVFAGG